MHRYFVADNGVSRGPFTLDQISETIRSGQIAPFTLMWTEGMSEWAQADQVLADTGLLSNHGQPASRSGKSKSLSPNWSLVGLAVLALGIIGIVISVSIPEYQDYLTHAKVTAAIEQARNVSDKMSEFRRENGHWPVNPSDIGLSDANDIAGAARLTIDRSGTVLLKFTALPVNDRALSIRIGEDGHHQCTTNLPRNYTDRACSHVPLSSPPGSAAQTAVITR